MSNEQKPVAWGLFAKVGGEFVLQHPVRFSEVDVRNDRLMYSLDAVIEIRPLYTSPPQRKPLTEKEMYIVEEEARKNFRLSQSGPRGQMITYWDSLTPWLIRAVERAHGIGDNP